MFFLLGNHCVLAGGQTVFVADSGTLFGLRFFLAHQDLGNGNVGRCSRLSSSYVKKHVSSLHVGRAVQ